MTFTQPFADYEILARVGSGAMGTVFRARQKKLDRIVALKVLKPSLARDARYVERLTREARIVAAMNHPNIVAGYDLGQEGGYHFFVMEYFEGRSLKDLLKEWGSFPEEQVLDVGVQVALALDHAFQRGVIHRDVKPANILIDTKGRVKLTDMGLAKGPEDLTITREGATVGTPQYASPEQIRDPQAADVRSDLYSLGATLFHMATGVPPFQAETTGQLIAKLLHDRAPSAHGINPSVGDGLSLVIRKLLAKDPGLRYQTPGELLEDLGRVRRQEAPQVDLRRLDRAESRRPRRRWVAVVGLLAAVLAAGGVFWWQRRGEPEAVLPTVERARAQLDARGRQTPGLLARWRLFDDETRRATASESERVAARSLREELESEWRSQIRAFFADQIPRARVWLAEPAHWRAEPKAFLAEVVDPAFGERFGCAPGELPGEVRLHYEGERLQRIADVNTCEAERDRDHLARLQAWLAQELPAAEKQALSARDFVRGGEALRALAEVFHGRGGRPARGEVSDRMAQDIAEVERKALEPALGRLAHEERACAEQLERELADSLEPVRKQLAAEGSDPRLVLAAVQRLETELGRDYPPAAAFHPEQNPWPKVDMTLRGLRRAAEDQRIVRERQVLEERLVFAFATLAATGTALAEEPWLAHLELEDAEVQRLRATHLELLRDGREAARMLAEVLAARQRVWQIATGGETVSVRVERGADGSWRFATGLDPVAGVPPAVPWAELAAAAGEALGRDLDARARAALTRGLALLALLGGDRRLLAGLGETDARWFANSVQPVVIRVRQLAAQGAAAGAAASWQQVIAAWTRRDLGRLRTEVPAFLSQHSGSAVAVAYKRTLSEIQDWMAAESRREQRIASLRTLLPDSAEIEIGADGGTRLEFSAGLLALANAGGAWQVHGDVADGVPRASLAEALQSGLVVSRSFGEFEPDQLELELRFPVAASEQRLLLVTFEGHAVALAVLRSGALAVAIGASDLLEKPDGLRRALQRPLEEALLQPRAYVLPGAWHRLQIRLRPNVLKRVTTVRAIWDDVLLREETLARPAVHEPRCRIATLSGLGLRKIVVQALP